MGMLDTLIKGATQGGGITDIVRVVFDNCGGLNGLVEKLRAAGLGKEVDSWISTGQNLPVSAREIAAKLGVDPAIADQLAELLPKTIDQLTPNGRLPE